MFVRFFGWFEDEDSIFIAMEYIEKGTLERYISARLMEQDVKSIALQMLTGLKIMHEEGFTHRDLKPQVRRYTAMMKRFIVLISGTFLRTSSLYKTHQTGGSRSVISA